ncbi:hypothetical protein ACFYN9_22045 [Streptomyces collinus]|uniref:hypothetical protein n=1 Tax=Streptomyces collinus TaxID=42684 RepID=UPI0036779821
MNPHAAGDIVAQNGLATVAAAVRDEPVHNGIADPHVALRYLDKQLLADLIVKASTL